MPPVIPASIHVLARLYFRIASACLFTAFILSAQTACHFPFDFGQSATAGYFDTLQLKFDSSRSRAKAGEPVNMRFAVTNTGTQPIIIDSQDKAVMDIEVIDAASHNIVLSWSEQHPTQVLHHAEWKPGETKAIELMWTPTPEQQSYGRFMGLGGLLSKDSKVVMSAGFNFCLGTCY